MANLHPAPPVIDPPFPPAPPRLPGALPADAAPSERVGWVMRAITQVLVGRLPERTLLPGERQELAGILYPGASAVVNAVIEGLRRAPRAFPDLPFDAAELEEELRQAQAWFALRAQLLLLVESCSDAYTLALSGAVRRSHAAIEHLLAGAQRPALAPHLDHEARLHHLGHAAELRRHCRQQIVKRRQRSQAERALPLEEQAQRKAEARARQAAARRAEQRRARVEQALAEVVADLQAAPAATAPPDPAPPAAAPAQKMHTRADPAHCADEPSAPTPRFHRSALDPGGADLAKGSPKEPKSGGSAWAPLTTSSTNMIPRVDPPERSIQMTRRWRRWRSASSWPPRRW